MFSVNKSISLSNYSNQIRFYSMNEIESGARNILIKSFYFLLTNNDSIANILKSMNTCLWLPNKQMLVSRSELNSKANPNGKIGIIFLLTSLYNQV